MLQHKFHCKRFFFSLSLNTPHTYTSSSQLPQLSRLNVISTLKYKIKLFFQQFSRLLLFNSINCTTVQDFFFLSLPQFPQASTLFLYSSTSPLFSFGKLSLAALKNSFSRTSFEQKKSLFFCTLFQPPHKIIPGSAPVSEPLTHHHTRSLLTPLQLKPICDPIVVKTQIKPTAMKSQTKLKPIYSRSQLAQS